MTIRIAPEPTKVAYWEGCEDAYDDAAQRCRDGAYMLDKKAADTSRDVITRAKMRAKAEVLRTMADTFEKQALRARKVTDP